MSKQLLISLSALVLSATSFAKGNLSCYEEEGTRSTMCINEAAVTVNGVTRASALYTGGPNGVRKTSFTMVVNCAKGISTLQDKDGVNFAGAMSSGTEASRSLSKWVCDVPKPKSDPKLKQF